MMYGPLRVPNKAQAREVAGTVMILALTVGLTLGVCTGFAIDTILL